MHTNLPLTPEQLRENRLEWIQALESGKYKQTRLELCTKIGNDKAFCCLGVLQDLVNETSWIRYEGEQYYFIVVDDKNVRHKPTTTAKQSVGLDSITEEVIIQYNDLAKYNFHRIAKFLRELWNIHE